MIIEISDLSDKELIPYKTTSEIQLIHWFEPDKNGIFIAESPKVIRRALSAGYQPVSFLLERKYINGQAKDIVEKFPHIPVYTADSDVLTQLTGFKLTQGALSAMRRKSPPCIEQVLDGAERIAVLEDVMNQTNIGAVFRSASALGFDAVLLTSSCSDPLYRRSIRVSMGTVFQIPWTYIEGNSPEYIRFLQSRGFTALAMALRNDTVSISDSRLKVLPKIAVVLGTEGDGLKSQTIQACDYTIKIPMFHGVDSLNVASASAIAFWELSKRN